jgi:hypothetical protein
MAQEVREALISQRVDCLAVPLPPSVEAPVERAIGALPTISLVLIPETDQEESPTASFVPVDPCQAVIMGIRVAMREDIPRAYVDRGEVLRADPRDASGPLRPQGAFPCDLFRFGGVGAATPCKGFTAMATHLLDGVPPARAGTR